MVKANLKEKEKDGKPTHGGRTTDGRKAERKENLKVRAARKASPKVKAVKTVRKDPKASKTQAKAKEVRLQALLRSQSQQECHLVANPTSQLAETITRPQDAQEVRNAISFMS